MDFPEPFQHKRNMGVMFSLILGVHKDNMDVDDDKVVRYFQNTSFPKPYNRKGASTRPYDIT